jgi:hypothetical protein
MALGKKTGGRRKGTKNKIPSDKRAAIERASALAELDRQGTSMGHIQIDAARHLFELAAQERAKGEAAQRDVVIRLLTAASKIAHDASAWLYPTLQAIKLGGEEDAAPIRIESLSDYQLEMLIKRLQRG